MSGWRRMRLPRSCKLKDHEWRVVRNNAKCKMRNAKPVDGRPGFPVSDFAFCILLRPTNSILTCRNGHRWERPRDETHSGVDGPLVCPVCGVEPSEPTFTETAPTAPASTNGAVAKFAIFMPLGGPLPRETTVRIVRTHRAVKRNCLPLFDLRQLPHSDHDFPRLSATDRT